MYVCAAVLNSLNCHGGAMVVFHTLCRIRVHKIGSVLTINLSYYTMRYWRCTLYCWGLVTSHWPLEHLINAPSYSQGCPQDVKSQERDETETVNLQDPDVPLFQTLKTETKPRRWTLKTETRPRRSTFKTETRRDVPKNELETRDRDVTNVSRPQCRSLKTPTGEVCHFTNCFCESDPLFSSWYIRKPDALHACSQD